MVWQLFAFLAAFFSSVSGIFSKKNLKLMDEYVVSASFRFFALPFVLPILLFIEIPPIGSHFWLALIGWVSSATIALILAFRALRHSDMSLTTPMIAFTPLFLLITSPIINNEFPSLLGLVGVLVIVAGSYLMNIKEMKRGYLEPFKALIKQQGPRLTLIAAFMWSITSNFDKIGIQNSSPLFWPIATTLTAAAVMLPIVLLKSKNSIGKIPTNWKTLAPVGLFSALTLVFQMFALSLTLVAYVISIKRLSAVMSVIWGKLFFKEKGIRERLIGAVIMVLGVVLITLS